MPRASNLTQLSSMALADDYLFYRVSEGGAFFPFNSLMPALQDQLDERKIWEIVSHVQALGHTGS